MIDLPKLGTFKADGLTCKQIKDTLTAEWGKYVRDLSVEVQLTGFTVNVLGEVKIQGAKLFKNERANIFDAIGFSGGFDDNGKRKDVMLIREDSGKRTTYFLDLTDAKIYQSPAFQLLQNDVVYVGANERKFKQIRTQNFQQTVAPLSQVANIGIAVANMILIIFAIRR
jgi:polysaccharide export outer membrane protein